MSFSHQHSGRSVAVTGAGAGLGRDIALGFAAKEYTVFGTAMSSAEVREMEATSDGRIQLTVCDLTKQQAVRTWTGAVSDTLGDAGLNLLVNNAGILTPGPLEVLPLEAIRYESEPLRQPGVDLRDRVTAIPSASSRIGHDLRRNCIVCRRMGLYSSSKGVT